MDDQLPIPKQRGIYSEILTTEDTQNLKVSARHSLTVLQLVSVIGPAEANLIEANKRQKVPRARGKYKFEYQFFLGISKGRKATVAADSNVIGKNYFRNPDVNKGFYSKKREGVSDPDPKVMEPFKPIPGKPPRKVVVDRQRKLYASLNIEELLLELGIDYRNPKPNPADWLPLEPFDDLEYDCRLPNEWVETGMDENGAFSPVPAMGLFYYEDNSAEWKPVLIETHDDAREVYCGQWDGTNEYVELTRINLLFNSEDPRIFAQRVAQAHQERIFADSQIRYNFFIDNMPTDDLPEIDQEQSTRIYRMAMASRYLKSRTNVESASIMYEVNQDYARTMNKIIMDKTLEKTPEELEGMIPANLTLPDKPRPKPVPYYGQVPIPPHDFPDSLSNFNFSSLYIKEETIRAMVEIRGLCNDLMTKRIFDTSQKNMQRIDEFKMIQTGSISQFESDCGENGWVGNLARIIKTHFDDVGKGWFNIHEKSKSTYEFGKLKKFLTLVNFMMQDTVLNICKDSIKEFVAYILGMCPIDTQIVNTHEVKNSFNKKAISADDSDFEEMPYQDVPEEELDEVQKSLQWLHKQFDKNKDPEPLFVVDLIVNNDTPIPRFTNQPEEMVTKILDVFDNGVEKLGEIKQIETFLLGKTLFKGQHKFVKAPQRPQQEPGPPDETKKTLPDENAWLWYAFKDLEAAMEKAIKPLHEYLQTFSQFEPEHRLNADKYIKLIEDPPEGTDPMGAEELRADILKHKADMEELQVRIPESVKVSIFTVIIKDIRNKYCGTYQQIIDKEIKLIASLAIDKTRETNMKFEEINEAICREPTDIEDLYEIKKFMVDSGVTIEKLKKEIDATMRCYEVATEFHHEFSNSDQDRKWFLYGAPQRTMALMEEQVLVLEKQKENFLKEMESEQEQFNDTLELLENSVKTFAGNFNKVDDYLAAAEAVESVNQRLQSCIDESKKYNLRENLTGAPITDYSNLQKMVKDFQPYSNLWLTARTWNQRSVAWKGGPWDELDPEELEQTFEQCLKTISTTTRFFKDKAGLEAILEVASSIKALVDDFKPVVPIAMALRKTGMVDRHWDAISTAVGFDIRPTEGFTLQTCIDKGLLAHTELCEDTGEKAYKEFNIEKSLKKMKDEWVPLKFHLPEFKQTGTYIISGFDDAVQLLDEHIVTSQAMKFSPFRGPFEEEIIEWCDKMMTCQDTLEEWVTCQREWTYLQPIFDSPDIAAQLKSETKRFRSVDATWRSTMQECKQDPSILNNCSIEGLRDKFTEANKNLDIVRKGLNEYLEKKRTAFARFYFLSDDDLLEILSQTKEVKNVRPHLKKVFEAINDLVFDQNDCMLAMISAEKESVNFIKKVDPSGKQVEFWMGDVEKTMCNTTRHVLRLSIDDYYEKERTQWVRDHAGQCVLNGSQVHWTTDVEEKITEKGVVGLQEYYDFSQKQLLDSVALVRTKLSKLEKKTMNALIVIDVHARDVITKLIEAGIDNINEFEWIMQLRYYWAEDDVNKDGNCYVRCVQTDFPYGYEYLGNSMRLVITPLTDKCYMTLMGALDLNLGGAPAGPAGTGKTESTKDLAKALAKQCVVFNCSDSMDHLFVAKYFKGLASCGAWVCFDEFNRINVEVLSVIAQQLLILFGAKAERLTELTFEGSFIKMKPTFCVFITMNPGYAGRSELPDNLVALFRPVAMMVPDYALIAEIMLYSFGYSEGKPLSGKMVTTFRLASEQLSSQHHYDYGMRAVRSVINASGLLKNQFPDDDENQLMLRSLREVNVPKFLKDDIPLFENIIVDLFPGVERPVVDYGDLASSIDAACNHFNVQKVELFNEKIMQLYDTIQVRHGLMIVGPTGGGKTKIYKVLQKACSDLSHTDKFNKVRVDCLNPKSITQDQLYGFNDPSTGEWQDGILAKIVLEASKDESPDLRWVMFDGPVDAIWIENMNTVLDDNKKLCLNSGQVIPLTPRMTMMFEVADLAVASPATVSRCGMVYVEPASLGLEPYFVSWLNTLPPKVAENPGMKMKLRELGDKLLEDGVWFVYHDVREPVKTCANNIIQSLFRLFDCWLADYVETEIKKVPADRVDELLAMTPSLFFFAFIWSLGTTTDLNGRLKFDQWIRDKMKECQVEFPMEGLVYDYCYDLKTKTWKNWLETLPEYNVNTQASFNEILVPTVDSIRMKAITQLLITNGKHVLCPGPTGTGKSVYIGQMLTYELEEKYMTLTMVFSAQTSANQTQDQLDGRFDKRRKGVYGPPVGQKFVLFVDDLNMPKKEEWGAIPPLEILRQYMDHSGWYDRKSKDKPFLTIEDLIIVSACGPPGGGRQDIPERLQRHFNILTYTDLKNDSIERIFSTILSAFYQTFLKEIKDAVEPIIEITLDLYDQVLNGPLKPTPNKSHYLFNLRDISRIIQGLVNAAPRDVTEPVHVVRMWIHESRRVFGDRLIDNKDRGWIDELLVKLPGEKFKLTKEDIMNSERLLFGDYMDGIDDEARVYKQIPDTKVLVQKVIDFLEEYNGAVKTQMKLVMFLDACDHVSRITRIIRQPLGNALLLGVGGSGRQSLSRLATFIANYKIFQIEVVKGYGMSNWREDAKVCLLQAGIENKPISFLFVDTQIVNEQMLEDINNILNAGDIPSLYKVEDMEPIYKVGKQACIEQGIAVNTNNMFVSYVGRIRKNMHMIIAMSPLGEIFRARLRKFPSLVNNCTIDWFSEWPEEALLGVGRGQIEAADLNLGESMDACVQMFTLIHQSVERESADFKDSLGRFNYVTPTSFLEQLVSYGKILRKKRKDVGDQKMRLVKGLDVLEKAQGEIDTLKAQIAAAAPELAKTKAEVQETMKIIAAEKKDADEERAIVSKDEAIATQQEEEANELLSTAQVELDKALPALEAATAILNKLDKGDFYTLQGIKLPTPAVVSGMECACIMLGVKADKKVPDNQKIQNDTSNYFLASKKNLLNDPAGFLSKMKNFDKENISEKTVKRINEIFKSGDFTLDKAQQASSCLVGIYKWCEAMVMYHEILKTVNPLREQAKVKKVELAKIQKDLAEKRAKLKAVQDKLDNLERTYQEKVDFEANLQAKIDEANLKLYRANKIIEGLSGEKSRWEETVQRLTRDQGFLIGNCLVGAGLMAYGGAFTAQYRMRLEELWRVEAGKRGLQLLEGIGMKDLLEDPIQTKLWTAASLPNDDLSIENAIIMFNGGRWPIMIDPQNQANKFLKKYGFENAPKEMETMKASDPALMKMLELGVQFGRWFLVENIGEALDPALEPILQKQVDKSGNLKLGDKSIQYDQDFRFFMTTTLPNPHYQPETQVKVSILNFAITPFGLEEQMLNLFITLEMPELQKKKDNIVQQNAKAAKDLFDCEDKILEGLTKNESIADILKTDDLIIVLDESKTVSDDIKVRMAESAVTEKMIDETREAYRPVAFRASLLFFTIIDLAAINDMYQYSLQWFSGLFGASVNNSTKTKEGQVQQRIENLNNHFTLSLYENICRSLFEVNKLMFSLVLCVKILFGDKKMDADEWRFFLAGPTGQIDVVPNPTTWLGELEWGTMWKQLFAMSKLKSLEGFDKYFLQNSHEFQAIFDSNNPQDEPLPGKWNDLDYFQKMLIFKAIRLDKIPFAIQNFVKEKIGEQYILPPTFSVAKSYKDSSATTPLIFVLSQGSDPVADFKRFAEEMNMSRKYDAISLGRGQDKKAINCINENASRGGWALLMNCHLASGFMPKLEVIVDTLDQTQPHRDFRLWLTSMPAKTFPVSVLQNSVKMTLEPPSGLRQNVRSSYEALDWQQLEDMEKPDIGKKLLWSFCFFHAIVQDRRKFGPIGWNIRYAFTNEDLMVCRKQTLTFVDRFDAVPYKTLNYLGAEVNYGGRVTDYNDVLLITTILRYYICEGALQVGHKFSTSGKYTVIDGQEKEDYLAYIDSLPLNPEPEAFGMHENAEITTKQSQTIALLLDVLKMQPKSGGGGGASREEIIGKMAADLEKRAPPPFNTEMVAKNFPTMYNESMNTVLFQECVRYNGLLNDMGSSLKLVQRALLGEVVMSEDLEKMSDAIFDNRVPPVWVKKGFLSMKPLSSWIEDCNRRINFLNDWIENGTPKVFWISGFFFPQAFFTGTLQNYARAKFIAVDRINFDFVFRDELTEDKITEKPESGAYCYGMYIEGCKWNYETHMLDDSDPKKLFVDMPMLWFKAVEDRKKPESGIYEMPIYKVLSRSGTLSTTGHSTNFVMKCEVPTDQDPDYWIKAGVAGFLALRD